MTIEQMNAAWLITLLTVSLLNGVRGAIFGDNHAGKFADFVAYTLFTALFFFLFTLIFAAYAWALNTLLGGQK